MSTRNPSGTQEDRVYNALLEAKIGRLTSPYVLEDAGFRWVNKLYFLRVLGLTQVGRAIWNLEHDRKIRIIHSDFRDEYGFMYYRLPEDWEGETEDPIKEIEQENAKAIADSGRLF